MITQENVSKTLMDDMNKASSVVSVNPAHLKKFTMCGLIHMCVYRDVQAIANLLVVQKRLAGSGWKLFFCFTQPRTFDDLH